LDKRIRLHKVGEPRGKLVISWSCFGEICVVRQYRRDGDLSAQCGDAISRNSGKVKQKQAF
jgi:hypothetical protein